MRDKGLRNSDDVAQTISYGLFVEKVTGRSLDDGPLSDLLSQSEDKDISDAIARLNDFVDGIDVSMLSGTDVIMESYEEFLAYFDPSTRKSCGVYYTPKPVADFMVRFVDYVLREDLGAVNGLSSGPVQILDPACGTGMFISSVIRYVNSSGTGMDFRFLGRCVDGDLPRHLHGIEILPVPYMTSLENVRSILRKAGYASADETLPDLVLADSLDGEHDIGSFEWWDEGDILTVIGNPPYSAEPSNIGEWITGLVDDYKREPDSRMRLDERNPKWLNDDYVRFVRYAEHLVCEAGRGIVAFINPHSWIGNPSFRGMRWHLLGSFDKIYIINLHGNVNWAERCPDGSRDENVFDVRNGVCVNVFVRSGEGDGLTTVLYTDVWGTRDSKYSWMESTEPSGIPWVRVTPQAPMYYLTLRDTTDEDEYQDGFSIKELFVVGSQGLVTGNDRLAYGSSIEEARRLVEDVLFFNPSVVDDAKTKKFMGRAAPDVLGGYEMTRVAYRPFEDRYTAYTGRSEGWMARPRTSVMPSLMRDRDGGNVALVTMRQVRKGDFHHVFVTDAPTDVVMLSGKDNAYVFPLWTYDEGSGKWSSNLDDSVMRSIREFITDDEVIVDPWSVFDYVYGILWSSVYRRRFETFLKEDFPRVPYPKTSEMFSNVSRLGGSLRSLHLMKSDIRTSVTFTSCGDFHVTKVKPVGRGQVYVNDSQYFSGVTDTSWNMRIGAYEPARKMLSDMKGKVIDERFVTRYAKVIAILDETKRVQDELDGVIVES